jgi:ParB-like chromosome segregation protein Spo0J
MDDLQIAWRPLGELIPYARNPRTHSDAQVAQIAASIREFGWTNPVLVDGANGIIAGHGRVLAARKLGLERVPVIELAHLSEAQKRAYVLADNQLALNAGWDEELLRLELADLSELGFDLGLIGFGEGELERLLAGGKEGLTGDDEAPALPEQAITQPGDLWVLGAHRLLCGDATVQADVERVLDGQLADMTFTDPPYNVEYGSSAKDKLRGNKRKILNDDLGSGFEAFLHKACVNMLSVNKGGLLHLHELVRAAHAAAGIHGGRRQVEHFRDLGEEHVHPRPG